MNSISLFFICFICMYWIVVSIPDEWSHCILQSANFLYFSWSWSEQVKLRKAKNTECANNNITENIPQFYANSYFIIISNTHTYTQNWSISRLSFIHCFPPPCCTLHFKGSNFIQLSFFLKSPTAPSVHGWLKHSVLLVTRLGWGGMWRLDHVWSLIVAAGDLWFNHCLEACIDRESKSHKAK